MSQYRESTGDFLYRVPLSVDLTGGAVVGPVDITCAIPSVWPAFWDRVLSTGADVRVTLADGVTLAVYDIQGWNYTTKTLTIEVQAVTSTSWGAHIGTLWLYWGNASAVDAHTAFVPAGAVKTAYVAIEQAPRTQYVIVHPAQAGATKAPPTIVKQANEVIDVYFDFGLLLRQHDAPYAGSLSYEEISYVSTVDVQTGGASAAALFTASSVRVYGNSAAKVQVKAGGSGTTYTIIVQVTTTLGEVLEGRARLYVQNTAET